MAPANGRVPQMRTSAPAAANRRREQSEFLARELTWRCNDWGVTNLVLEVWGTSPPFSKMDTKKAIQCEAAFPVEDEASPGPVAAPIRAREMSYSKYDDIIVDREIFKLALMP